VKSRVVVALVALAAALLPGRMAPAEDPVAALSLIRPKPAKDAPDFRVRTPDDRPLHLAELKGKVVFLNFWATWCEPCEREMPAMERLHRALGPEGLSLVAVSVDESAEPVDQFRERFGLTFKILLDPDKRVANLYQTYRFPETLLIGRDGVVIERYVGPRDWDSPLYEARIRRLLEDKEPS